MDDGSSDNTQDIVKKWISENEISIRYLYKENGGKHTALNFAIEQIESELIFIVDSDDILTDDAVETILRYHRRYEAVSTVLANEIWFVLGMSICIFNVQIRGKKSQGAVIGLIFLVLSVVAYTVDI